MKALFASRPDTIWDKRGVGAFALSPIVPALIAVLLYDMFATMTVRDSIRFIYLVASLSYPHMVILAIPCAFVLNLYRKVSFATVALTSFLIGAIPTTIFHIYAILHPEDGTNPGFTTVFNPHTAITLLIFGGSGLSAGIAWWFIAIFRKPAPQTA